MPISRDAVSRTANVGTVGKIGLKRRVATATAVAGYFPYSHSLVNRIIKPTLMVPLLVTFKFEYFAITLVAITNLAI